MRKFLLLLLMTFSISALFGQEFISEIHYDDGALTSGDDDEMIEVYIENAPADVSTYSIVLYNGSNNSSYNTRDLSTFTRTNTADGAYFHFIYPTNGIQNGAPDGIAFVGPMGLIEFLSYEGSFTANGGPADGVTSTDIGVAENGSTMEGTSMQNDGFGNWVTGAPVSPGAENASNLPVEFTKFTAKKFNNENVLSWATATEINNEKFMVERSTDGSRFYNLGSVKGQGTSAVINEYSFVDYTPLAGMNYYRLKQMDFDGNFEYSTIVTVDNREDETIKVYPTTLSDYLTIEANENAEVKIFSVTGKLILNQSMNNTKSVINLSELATGSYFVAITTGTNTVTKQVIKK